MRGLILAVLLALFPASVSADLLPPGGGSGRRWRPPHRYPNIVEVPRPEPVVEVPAEGPDEQWDEPWGEPDVSPEEAGFAIVLITGFAAAMAVRDRRRLQRRPA